VLKIKVGSLFIYHCNAVWTRRRRRDDRGAEGGGVWGGELVGIFFAFGSENGEFLCIPGRNFLHLSYSLRAFVSLQGVYMYLVYLRQRR